MRLLPYWQAFWALHGARAVTGAGAQPIPVSEVLAYCALCGFRNAITRHELLLMVQAMDQEWFALMAERKPSRAAKPH